MDALKIETAILAGYDWGAGIANTVAALWPARCKAMGSVSGYLIANREVNKRPLPPKAEYAWWYQFYFATERGSPADMRTGPSPVVSAAGSTAGLCPSCRRRRQFLGVFAHDWRGCMG